MSLSQLLLVASVALGALLGEFFSLRDRGMKFLTTFSGAYLLGIGVFHLLPEIFTEHSHYYGLMMMAGFFVQLLLEAMSKGLEHGHAHLELFKGGHLPFGVLISLFLHAFLESLPVGSATDLVSQRALLWGLLVHKIPVSVILYSSLRRFSSKMGFLFFWMILFAAMAPLGVLVGEQWPILIEYQSELMAFVFGIFLHISTTILFESNQSHQFNLIKLLMILGALGVAWLSVAH